MINSGPFTGVEISCSIVPRSHSRATVNEVISAAMTIINTPIRPGMMKFRDSMSSLNHTRGRTSSGCCRAGPPLRWTAFITRFCEKVCVTASA